MLKKVNFHTHTERCRHAVGKDREYILEAIENNLDILGFSDHGPYPDNRFRLRMNYIDLLEYSDTMNKLKDEFKEKIKLKIGLEIEYIFTEDFYCKYLLEEVKLDYLALGQHVFLTNSGELKDTYFLKSTKDYIDYAESICKGMKSGYFTFIAHPDLIFLNDFPWDDNCEKACDLIIETAKKQDLILEFNANGLRRGLRNFYDGKRYPYPHKRFWEKAASKKIKTLINADAHSPNDIWDKKMDEAYSIANSLGLNLVYNIK